MQFKDVIGQQETKEQLVQMSVHNRVSHAQLFLAREGTGGLPMALAFAQYMVCEKVQRKNVGAGNDVASLFGDALPEPVEQSVPADSCGVCAACKKAADMVHPDIHYSYPIFPKKPGEKSKCTDFITEWRDFIKTQPYGNSFDWLQSIKAENKQGNINVHECQDIIKKMNLKSFESAYKILIMWMPEMLGKEGNILLKLIEEPPANTLFIFVAENDENILQTILSRTQLVKFSPLSNPQVQQALIERERTDSATAAHLSKLAEGNYREALHLLQHADENQEEILRSWLNVIATQNLPGQVKWIDEMSKTGRERQKQFLKYFVHLLQQSIHLRIIDEAPDADNDFARRINKLCNIAQQEAIMQEMDQASYYIERNANAKVLFHALTIKLFHIIKHEVVVVMQ